MNEKDKKIIELEAKVFGDQISAEFRFFKEKPRNESIEEEDSEEFKDEIEIKEEVVLE